jgi:catechol 2,3-dioxygenase-like lactoylglutathione lyase family enzyme
MPSFTVPAVARITGLAPQLLVADLDQAVAYYRDRLGFTLDFAYDDFYASVSRDGFAIHLKHGPSRPDERAWRKQEEHLDAYVAVTGIRALFEELRQRGAAVVKPLADRPWGCLDFYVEDPDGHLLCFSELVADGA